MRITLRVLLAATILVFLGAANAQQFSADNIISRTVVLSQAVHFNDPDGADVLVPPGAYWVIPDSGALQLLSFENGDSFVIRAVAEEHVEVLMEDIVISTPGTEHQPDVHSISYMYVDGSELAAEGTYSGIKARGLLGDAKEKAAAARREAQKRAHAAKRRAQNAAAEARRRAEEAAANLRAMVEQFLGLTCEEKLNAAQYVTQRLADRVASDASNAADSVRSNRPLIDAVIKKVVEEAIESNRPMIDTAIFLAAEARDPKTRAEIDRLVTNATCGIEPDATANQISQLASNLYQSAVSASQGSVSTRGVRDFMDNNLTISFDVSGGLTVPVRAKRAKTAAVGVGIAVGARGNPPCTNPRQARVCVRALFYRHIGGSTPEAGFAVPVAVGVWRVNPRDLQGRYTNIGGSISFESIAAIYAAATGTATVASGGAAAPSTLGTIAGLTGIGFDLAFDRNIWSLVDCAIANPSNWETVCRELPRLVGIVVNGGFSASVAPLEVHRVSGSTWTWWWEGGHMADVHGPTRLWKDAVDYVLAQR